MARIICFNGIRSVVNSLGQIPLIPAVHGTACARREGERACRNPTVEAIRPGNSAGPVFNESGERPALIVSESENAESSPFDVFYSIRADSSPTEVGATIE
jgi:hypothetical protein